MKLNTLQLALVLFVCALVVGMVAPAAVADGGAGEVEGQTADPTAEIDDELAEIDGPTEVVVRLGPAEMDAAAGDAISALQAQTDDAQQPVVRYAEQTDGVYVKNSFFLANALLLEIEDAEQLKELAKIEGVQKIHDNFEVELIEAPSEAGSQTSAADDSDTTYGLDQINAPDVWETHGTKGEGAAIAVLDTGVDITHQDLEGTMFTEDPDDPTFPGGWAEVDGEGELVEGSEPHDTGEHGTHVSGTVVGGDASGTHIGVAPEADLIHGLVLPGGGGTFAQIVGGMEWAVDETEADAISMSLGADGYHPEMIEPVINAEEAGVPVIGSSGNSGHGVSGSPANVFDGMAVGASDADMDIAGFSSGETVDTETAWGDDAPDHWPDEYIVPDVSAPGVAVESSVPGDGYSLFDGTSMAAPHVSGAYALAVSASGGSADPADIRDAMESTAFKPDGEPDEQDERYGHGIIDALATADLAALDSGVEGTVTDESGDPIEGATVSLEDERSTETDADGAFELLAQPGEYELTADTFGFAPETETVEIEEDETTTVDIELADSVDAELVDDQAERIEGGDAIDVTFDAVNVESITVDVDTEIDESDITLFVGDEETEFGEPVESPLALSGELTVTVETAEGTAGEVALEHTFAGMGDELSVSTGPTQVFEELNQIAVVDDQEAFGDDIVDTLADELPLSYEVSAVTSDEAMEGYDVVVVQNVGAQPDEFVQAVDGHTGVLYLDQWGADSQGIEVRSEVMGDPEETEQDDFGDVPIQYEVSEDHEIFDGIAEAGDTVVIHDSPFGDRTWFEGTDFDVLADVGTQDETEGPSFAVDEFRNVVLASTLGYNAFVGDDDFTDDADAILGNSVEFLAENEAPGVDGTITLDEKTVQPGDMASIDLSTELSAAGYEAHITFDPDVAQVNRIDGHDFADPITEIDNEAGTISMAQAQANDEDAPTFARIEFEHVGDLGDETTLEFTDNLTSVNAEDRELTVDTVDGMLAAAPCELGDVNADGQITPFDATLTQQYIVGQEPADEFHTECADMNGDGEITSADVTLILNEIVDGHVQTEVAN